MADCGPVVNVTLGYEVDDCRGCPSSDVVGVDSDIEVDEVTALSFVEDTDAVGSSCADDEVDKISELERSLGRPFAV